MSFFCRPSQQAPKLAGPSFIKCIQLNIHCFYQKIIPIEYTCICILGKRNKIRSQIIGYPKQNSLLVLAFYSRRPNKSQCPARDAIRNFTASLLPIPVYTLSYIKISSSVLVYHIPHFYFSSSITHFRLWKKICFSISFSLLFLLPLFLSLTSTLILLTCVVHHSLPRFSFHLLARHRSLSLKSQNICRRHTSHVVAWPAKPEPHARRDFHLAQNTCG
jgi:hypothetical protein